MHMSTVRDKAPQRASWFQKVVAGTCSSCPAIPTVRDHHRWVLGLLVSAIGGSFDIGALGGETGVPMRAATTREGAVQAGELQAEDAFSALA